MPSNDAEIERVLNSVEHLVMVSMGDLRKFAHELYKTDSTKSFKRIKNLEMHKGN